MTGVKAEVSLPIRVDLAEGAGVTLTEPGLEEFRLSRSAIDRSFQLGLRQPPPPTTIHPHPGDATRLTLTGEARFLVGEVDLGVELGLKVVRRGLDAAADELSRGDGPSLEGDMAEDEPRVVLGDEARLFVMSIGEAAERWHELRPRVELWDRVVLTEDGRRVALIVAWDWWTLQRHRQASLHGAYWTHWHTGEFNIGGYAWDVMRLFEPRDARVRFSPDDGDGDHGASVD